MQRRQHISTIETTNGNQIALERNHSTFSKKLHSNLNINNKMTKYNPTVGPYGYCTLRNSGVSHGQTTMLVSIS